MKANFELEVIEKTQDSFHLMLFFHKNYEYFQGHFDEFALLPALIQIDLVVKLCNEFFHEVHTVKNLPNLKFMNPIKPDEEVHLTVGKTSSKIDFCYKFGEKVYSKGYMKI